LASFDFDQAEGLRRMLAGPKPRVFTFLSAASTEEKGAMLVNLGASLAQAGRDVLLFDSCIATQGVAGRMDATRASSLVQVARDDRDVDDAMQAMPQGFSVATLMRPGQRAAAQNADLMQRAGEAFDTLARRNDIVLVDAELGKDDSLPLPSMADGEIVVQVANTPESIKTAYTLIKRVNGQLGRRPFSILVTGATEKEAQLVYQNMAQAANRYLAVRLNSMGSVPADDHLKRAMHLGRSVIDAFPLAGASVAFRRLAGRFVLSDAAAAR
jgi:flagellar biosynthesis protein FlhG